MNALQSEKSQVFGELGGLTALLEQCDGWDYCALCDEAADLWESEARKLARMTVLAPIRDACNRLAEAYTCLSEAIRQEGLRARRELMAGRPHRPADKIPEQADLTHVLDDICRDDPFPGDEWSAEDFPTRSGSRVITLRRRGND